MNKEMSKKILSIQERAMEDETYVALMREHETQNERFLTAMESMTESQRSAVYDYFGVLVQMHYRILELACECIFTAGELDAHCNKASRYTREPSTRNYC